jgi:hypothetical protein
VAGVGHQHAIAPGERQIGGQCGALIAPLFLDDLDEQHLPALDHVLDLVTAAERLALLPQLVSGGFIDRRAIRFRPGVRGVLVLVLFAAAVVIPRVIIVGFDRFILVELCGAQALFLGRVFGLLAEQSIAIGLGDLIVIGMDFREGQEAVAVAAIVHERRLERWLYAGDLG